MEAGRRPEHEAVHRFLLGTLPGESVAPRRITESGHAAPEMLGTSNPAIFKGLRPAAFCLDGARHEVASWRGVLVGTCELLVLKAGLRRFAQAVKPIRGKKRVLFSADRSQLFMPIAIAGGDFFVEGNNSAADSVRLARRVIEAVRGQHSADSFAIELAE